MKNRSREFTYGSKEDMFLWGDETIFNWLGINFDENTKNNFGKQFNMIYLMNKNKCSKND
jgi:hypothetical protein